MSLRPTTSVSSASNRNNAPELAAFFARAHSPFLIVAPDMTTLAINRAATENLGLSVGDSLLTGFWSVSGTAVMRLVDAVSRGLTLTPISARTALDRLVEVDAFPLSDDGPIGVMITDRSSIDEAHQRLREQEERFRSLFEWAPVAMREEDFSEVVAWLDELRADGVEDLSAYLDANPEAVKRAISTIRTNRVNAATIQLLRAPSTVAVLRGFRPDELTPQVLQSFRDQFLTLWEGKTSHESDFVGVDFDGHPFECRLRWIIPRSNSGHDLSRVVVTIADLTELRTANRRLRRLVADKDRFIASVSHELRTPLAAVFGMSDELATNWENFDAAELQELVGMVATQSAELTSIVEDLLVAANLESGKIAIGNEILSLDQLASDAVNDCLRSDADLELPRVAGGPVAAKGDPVRVRQIIRNLITNAVRYGGEEISITVGNYGLPFVEVVDNGDGVPLEQRESIFEPYFQSDKGQEVLGSLGLGLSISRELARRMGGDLTYAYVDGSSVFRLELTRVPG